MCPSTPIRQPATRKGAGPGRTRADHLDVAAQAVAALARARQVRELADLVGASGLSATDAAYLTFEEAFGREVVDQGRHEVRVLDDTLEPVWRALLRLPRSQLSMLPAELIDARTNDAGADDAGADDAGADDAEADVGPAPSGSPTPPPTRRDR